MAYVISILSSENSNFWENIPALFLQKWFSFTISIISNTSLFFFLFLSLTHTNKKQIFDTHMRILRDNPSDKNSVQNLFTEVNELKSTSNSTISACGLSFWISSFSSAALLKSLAGITILTPFFANTLAVSAPIPDVAPLKKK